MTGLFVNHEDAIRLLVQQVEYEKGNAKDCHECINRWHETMEREYIRLQKINDRIESLENSIRKLNELQTSTDERK